MNCKAVIFHLDAIFDQITQQLMPGFKKAVAELNRLEMPLALVTSTTQAVNRESLLIPTYRLHKYFRHIWLCTKPADQVFEWALRVLRIPPVSTAIIDTQADRGVAWGRNRGLKTLWLCNSDTGHNFAGLAFNPTRALFDYSVLPMTLRRL